MDNPILKALQDHAHKQKVPPEVLEKFHECKDHEISQLLEVDYFFNMGFKMGMQLAIEVLKDT